MLRQVEIDSWLLYILYKFKSDSKNQINRHFSRSSDLQLSLMFPNVCPYDNMREIYLFDCFHREEVKQGYDTLLSQRWHLCTSCDKTLFTLMQDPFLPFHWFYDHKCCRQGNWYLEHKQCICMITRGYFINLILYIRSQLFVLSNSS